MAALAGALARPSLVAVILAAGLLAGGCASIGGSSETTASIAGPAKGDAAADRSELEKATEHWGKVYQKSPQDKTAALSYAKNLRAMGQKQAAYEVMQQIAIFAGNDREVAAEYGRLALELDQASLAARALAVADDPSKPDWRVISARGTAAAKLGQFDQAVPFFERALALAPGNPTVTNNLAMAYAATGHADKAEDMLRAALEQRPDDVRIRQNLTIVLGLRGEHAKAQELAQSNGGSADASANAAILKQMVKVSEPAPAAVVAVAKSPAPATSKKIKQKPEPVTTGSVPAAGSAGFADREADALIRKAIEGSKSK